MKKRFIVRKFNGDDFYSWAVIDSLTGQLVCGGCIKSEAQFHARELEKKYGTAHTV